MRSVVKRFFAIPSVIVLLVLLIYIHLLHACYGKVKLDQWGGVQNTSYCQISGFPIDNALPFIFGQNLLANHAKSIVIDWSIADRPPLQIAATLPILDFEQYTQQPNKYFDYYLFSVFLQLSWIGLVWGVLNILLKKRLQVAGVMIGLLTTSFFYFNSVFVWPKLLAASLVVFGAILLFETSSKNKKLFEYRYICMATLAITLGLLAHSSVAFTILAMIFVMLYDLWANRDHAFNWKHVIVAIFTSVALLVPWQIAVGQLTHSNRLVKWQLAGVISANDQRGTIDTIRQEYAKLSFGEWLHNKNTNVTTLFTGVAKNKCRLNLTTIFNRCNLSAWRTFVFFSTFFAFEFFIFGLPIVIWQLCRNLLDKTDRTLFAIGLLAILWWILLMFLPASTVVHQGSYATMLVFFILFAKKLAMLPQLAFFALISLQVILFYLVWIQAFIR